MEKKFSIMFNPLLVRDTLNKILDIVFSNFGDVDCKDLITFANANCNFSNSGNSEKSITAHGITIYFKSRRAITHNDPGPLVTIRIFNADMAKTNYPEMTKALESLPIEVRKRSGKLFIRFKKENHLFRMGEEVATDESGIQSSLKL